MAKRRNPNVRPESFHHHMLINDPFIHYIVENNKLLDIVESIIGPNIALYGAHYIAKKPIDGMPVGWHQDGSYWPLKAYECGFCVARRKSLKKK